MLSYRKVKLSQILTYFINLSIEKNVLKTYSLVIFLMHDIGFKNH